MMECQLFANEVLELLLTAGERTWGSGEAERRMTETDPSSGPLGTDSHVAEMERQPREG